MERRKRSVRRRINTLRVHVRRTTWEAGLSWVNWLEMSIMIKSIIPVVGTHSEWQIVPRHYNYHVPKTLTLVVHSFIWTRIKNSNAFSRGGSFVSFSFLGGCGCRNSLTFSDEFPSLASDWSVSAPSDVSPSFCI